MRIGQFKFVLSFFVLTLMIVDTSLLAGQQSSASDDRIPSEAAQKVANEGITESGLRADISFLADDLLEGRGPGTRGDELAQKYIATQFQTLGLKPAAPGGGFYQQVPLVGVITKPPKTLTFKNGDKTIELNNYVDYIVSSGQPKPESTIVDAELVFVGYGMQAPEYDWDDFNGVDVRGKILLVMNNDPADDPQLFAGRTRLYYGRWDYKYAKAAELGAAGVFIVHTTPSAGYPYQVVQTSWSGEQMALGGAAENRLPMEGWLSEAAAHKVVEFTGHDLDQLQKSAESRDFKPVPLNTTVSIDLKCLIRETMSANVLGLLEGSDPVLSKQWIIYCAHHDHLGMTEKRDEAFDNIYNGAVDNASGVATLLSIARAMAKLPESERPKRSILFVSVAAEEQGLLGSEYLAQNPPIPAGSLAAIINIDGINILGPTQDVVVIGKGKSDLDNVVERIAKWQNRVVVGDQFPDLGYYYRSDQFSLAKIGVPGVYLGSGDHVIGKPDGWGKEKLREWTDTIYHQTSDEYNENWDLRGAIDDAKLLFFVGLQVADQTQLPAWNVGDEFEATRLEALKTLGE